MKKKIVTLMLIGMMVVSATACGTSSDTTGDTTQSTEDSSDLVDESTQEDAADSTNTQKDLPDGDYQDMGDGTFYIACAGGTSEGGNVPIIYVDGDTMLTQCDVVTEGFNGSALSCIYIDGMLATKEQLSDSQQAIDLSGDALTVGTHKVEIVQYESDDPTADMITYKSASYEIKNN